MTTVSPTRVRPTRSFISLALTGALAASFIAAPALAKQDRDLDSRIESVLANSKLTNAKVGVCILDLTTGRTLADLHAETALIPASNMKILTSGAALLVLGKDFAFRTELIIDGDRLIVRGSGDPALADPVILEQMTGKVSVEGLLDAMASSVKKAGISKVSEVIVDDRIFDRQLIHPSWPKDQLDKWYCAEVSGLNFHTNILSVFPSPSSAGIGRPAAVLIEPSAPWLETENKARTAEAGRNTIRLARDGDSNHFTILGEVGIARTKAETTLHDPAIFGGQCIAAALPRAGIAVGSVAALPEGRTRLSQEHLQSAVKCVRAAQPGETLNGRVVAVVTTQLEDVLRRCNTDSYNLYAEAMIKRIGHDVTGEPGSWTSGSSVIRMTMAQHLGPEAVSSTVIADGSGMSREDRVSPRTIARWLDCLQKDAKAGEIFVNSLATPERRESMKRRFRDIRLASELHAKTGTIDGVRCLSGYLTDKATGHRLAFSIMVNDVKEGEQALLALQFHENVVGIADKWLAAQRPPKDPPPHSDAPSRLSLPPAAALKHHR